MSEILWVKEAHSAMVKTTLVLLFMGLVKA